MLYFFFSVIAKRLRIFIIFTVYLTVKELLEAPALPERTLLFTETGGLARSRPVGFLFLLVTSQAYEKNVLIRWSNKERGIWNTNCYREEAIFVQRFCSNLWFFLLLILCSYTVHHIFLYTWQQYTVLVCNLFLCLLNCKFLAQSF